MSREQISFPQTASLVGDLVMRPVLGVAATDAPVLAGLPSDNILDLSHIPAAPGVNCDLLGHAGTGCRAGLCQRGCGTGGCRY